jgi:hypothetical protein
MESRHPSLLAAPMRILAALSTNAPGRRKADEIAGDGARREYQHAIDSPKIWGRGGADRGASGKIRRSLFLTKRRTPLDLQMSPSPLFSGEEFFKRRSTARCPASRCLGALSQPRWPAN